MKKFGKVAALALSAAFALALAGCSNSSDGGAALAALGGGTGGGNSGGNGGQFSVNENTLDLRIKKNGVLYTGAGTSASVAASVSKSLSAASEISFAQIGGTEQVPGDGWHERLWTQDRYQTTHVKVENAIDNGVKGLKFTIKRPTSKYFNTSEVIREDPNNYRCVGDGKGEYSRKGWEKVDAGNGTHIAIDNYSWVGAGNGDYVAEGFEYVGEGKGIFKKVPKQNSGFFEYVGENHGDFVYGSPYFLVYVGGGNLAYNEANHRAVPGMCEEEGWKNISDAPKLAGDYVLEPRFDDNNNFLGQKLTKVENGSGNYNLIKTVVSNVGEGHGDYLYDYNSLTNVGEGKGDRTAPNGAYVGDNNGDCFVGTLYYAGEGKGNYKLSDFPYCNLWTGENKGCLRRVDGYDCEWADWDYDNNKGKGDYVRKVRCVGAGKGDYYYNPLYQYVGEGNGNYKEVFEYVGAGNGDYTTNKIYGGVNCVFIERFEIISGKKEMTTRAQVIIDNAVDEWTCFYPLCDENERYVFQVELLPPEDGDLRNFVVFDWVSIIAQGGVGDIDYSNLNAERHLELTYDGEKPISTITNCIPPENGQNRSSTIEYSAGTTEWKPGTTYWLAGYTQDDSNMVFDKDPCMEQLKACEWYKPEDIEALRTSRCFNATVKSKGKSQFFAEQYFKFQLPEAKGISEFRTIILRSDYAYMN